MNSGSIRVGMFTIFHLSILKFQHIFRSVLWIGHHLHELKVVAKKKLDQEKMHPYAGIISS